MAIPNQTITVRDPGLGIIEPGATVELQLGTAQTGTVNTLVSVSDKQAAIDEWGQGPLSESICHMLDIAGGPVLGMRLLGSVAGASGSVTTTRVDSSTGTVVVTVAVAFDKYEVVIEILSTGGVGIGTFKYSLDDGRTFSEAILIPSGGAYVIANTGLTVTFADLGGPVLFEIGDLFEFDTTAPYYSTTDLANAFTQILLESTAFTIVVLLGKPASTADGATMFAAFDTNLTSLETNFTYVRGIMDAGIDVVATAITAFASSADQRIAVVYGDADQTSSKPIVGYGTPKQSGVLTVAARAADVLVSTDLARFVDGSLTSVVEIQHDERQIEVLDQEKFTTLRTFIGAPGFFITNARFKSPLGSDFIFWQHGIVMDLACRTVYDAQLLFLSIALRTNANGTINEKDAVKLEEDVKEKLNAVLLDPLNAEGTPGHVSDFNYTVSRTANIQSTGILPTTVAIRPLGYVKQITTDIGFAVDVGN